MVSALVGVLWRSLKDTTDVCVNLYKVMLPLIIVIKVLSEFDLVHYIAMPLAPLMALMGLPEDLGIVWAVGMVVNLYSALIVFASMLPSLDPLTTGQVSIFALVMLYAHSLPIEARIAQQCGLSLIGQLVLRIGLAVAVGIGMHLIFQKTGWLSDPAVILFSSDKADPRLSEWVLGEVQNLVSIYVIIFALMLVQRAIDYFRISRLLELVLRPLLRLLGVSNKAASTIMIGMAMGIIYGSGLIIRAARDGSLSKRDVFGSVTLMGLAHAIIEDTFLMMVAGAHWSVVLVVRSLVAILAAAAVTRVHIRMHPLEA